MLSLFKLLFILSTGTITFASPSRRPVDPPLLKRDNINPSFSNPNAEPVGIVIDPTVQRDSCVTSPTLVNGRSFWLCRDTDKLTNEDITTINPFIVHSSAAWSNMTSSGPELLPIPPASQQGNTQLTYNYTSQLLQYPPGYTKGGYVPYVVGGDECSNTFGDPGTDCAPTTEVIIYPNSPAYPVASPSGSTFMALYEPIINTTNTANDNIECSLYFLGYNHSSNLTTLPTISLWKEAFFPKGAYCYGSYGGIVNEVDNYLYLYGQTYNRSSTALARVPLNEYLNINEYQYYYNNGTWSNVQPHVDDADANLNGQFVQPATPGVPAQGYGQGTFFYSDYVGRYVWLGQTHFEQWEPGVQVGVSTSANPYGPWTAAQNITLLPHGNPFGYSSVVHPEMSTNDQDVWLSYTAYVRLNDTNYYTQPLYKFEWSSSSASPGL
ncbi:hypothetical protein BD324DRAFT_652608 [Kockovaella imperatae]|uniref:DUF4185 domain-containing protein n=1 Tax=Kockovaella imperatae TaxID=4999 RepID=A0A1Y1UEI5_9TREE|nr:hypothetical protein BD324DRAFT_652608 [Kockovaella imperatae]ORX35485.1 hypothetical protein BD324DRAFT_652608 [Kockovaella imperatae]